MNSSNRDQDHIQPLDFTPLEQQTHSARLRLKPLAVIISLALLASALILAFLLSARSVVIQVAPQTAQLSIDGGFSFALADHYLIRPGDYLLSAEAEGYQPLRQAFRVGPEDHQLLQLSMQKLPGHLALTTVPAQAEVIVDGNAAGTTPLTLSDLPPGTHTLQIEAPRYLPKTSEVVIEGLGKTESLDVELDPAWGQVQLSSTPAGAEVSIGGEVRGTTPLTSELLASGEAVSVVLKGFKPWQQSLRVGIGETLVVPDIQLQPADGTLQLSSTPSGAKVTVNGQYRGTTPLEVELQPDQSHQLALFYNGYQTARRSLTLAAGEQQDIEISLKANLGEVRVLATPDDAVVWIDGVQRGTQGQTFKLSARPHRIELRKPGYASITRTVTPQPGLDQVVRVNLLTEQQARWASVPETITSAAGQTLLLFRPNDSFTMGAPRRESGRRANEVRREVELTRPFYLASHEVTNRQFKQFARQHSSSHAGGITLDQPNQPVVRVSWEQAARYCNWLSEKDNLTPFYVEKNGKVKDINAAANGYRLPTEAEWAWAARAVNGGEKRFAWGQQFPPADNAGNFADTSASASRLVAEIIKGYHDGFSVSAPVGSFRPNHRQLYDLEGNVAEWVNDYYGIELGLRAGPEKDPTGPEKGELRVIRGASWRHGNITELRLSYRDYGLEARDDLGFRVARYVE
ncbi:MAG: PEGA domain-containing protein [Gammaproteobacteria bacterium]|nr:MAG: PEGA domain-containing protein [Gammaproteobacteria bacterium]